MFRDSLADGAGKAARKAIAPNPSTLAKCYDIQKEVNMQEKPKKRYYTVEEYLALEEKAEYKSEYHDGEIIPLYPEEEEMTTQTEKRYYTVEEYLALEETAEYKSEYHDGEIVPMTGGTTNHNKIALNFSTNFKIAMRRQNYEIFIGDVRVWIPRYRRHVYPDVMVIQGEPIYAGTGTTTVTNPLLIVEVLSNSTKNHDRGDKFDYYRSIPEFREYILIDQYTYRVEQYAKLDDNRWSIAYYESAEAVLSLSAIEFQISLLDIYDRVNFDVPEEE